ncbi:MAG: exodeoxyribonuclease VII large subunit [Magnetococcales bacterium]|nr:exodeoxyribonuclease VII large subunit [Magnetococcales bacterium]
MTNTSAWQKALTVSDLTLQISDLLENRYAYIQVQGEISSLRIPPSGHAYFSLIDRNAQIRAVIWKTARRRMATPPREGDAVLVTGRITVYQPRGEYQLIVEGLETAGQGTEKELLLKLHAKLEKEGLFDQERKRPLPYLPETIGVVTSSSGAAIHDILHVLDKRFAKYHLILAHAIVQGSHAPEQIAQAIEDLNVHGQAQVIICGRGGGSADDLAAFNSEIVVRAIAQSEIPIISAVGHEVDITLADLAADYRAPTPSAAAETVLPELDAVQHHIDALTQRLHRALDNRLAHFRSRIEQLSARLRHPRNRLDQARLRCDELSDRLQRTQIQHHLHAQQRLDQLTQRLLLFSHSNTFSVRQNRIQLANQQLLATMHNLVLNNAKKHQQLTGRLNDLSPQAVLDRGYAIVRDSDHHIVRNTSQLNTEDGLDITFSQGRIRARVEKIEEE